MQKFFTFVVTASLVSFFSCTKEKAVPKGPDGKLLVSREANPDRVVFESELDVPKDHRSKMKKTDLMIWDLKTADGNVVSVQVVPVPTFPTKLVVTARQLYEPLQEGAHLLFSARIVKFGDESKPPLKGQLQIMIGTGPSEGDVVENKAVDQKLLGKFLKKLKMVADEEVVIGSKMKGEFSPALM